MAIDPSVEYSAQIDMTDPTGYPHGKARDVSTPGDGTGTPLQKNWLNDLFGFQQALLAESGQSPSGTPDKVGASQYIESIKRVARGEVAASNWTQYSVPAGDQNASYVSVGAAPENGTDPSSGAFVMVGTQSIGRFSPSLEAPFIVPSLGGSYPYLYCSHWSNLATRFIIVGSGGCIAQSTSAGETWTVLYELGSLTPETFYSVAESSSVIVTVGSGGAVATSTDGLTWVYRGAFAGAGTLYSVCWDETNGVFIAVGTVCLTSPDGITWTESLPATFSPTLVDTLNGVASDAEGNAVAVGNSGAVYYSSDGGGSWVAGTPSSIWSGRLMDVAWAEGFGLFVAVGDAMSYQYDWWGIYTSSDGGRTWKHRHPGISNPSNLQGITYNPCTRRLVAVGTSGTIIGSDLG